MKLLSHFILLLFSVSSFSQNTRDILLKSGTFLPANTIVLSDFSEENNQIFNGKYYRFMQFSVLPSTIQKVKMESLGIRFLEYIPNNTFVVSISEDISEKKLVSFNVIAFLPLIPAQKIDPKLRHGNCPNWAKDGNNVLLKVLLYKDVNLTLVFERLKRENIEIKEINTYAHAIIVSTNISEVKNIASNSFVYFIMPIDAPSFPENRSGRTLHRSNIINADYSTGRHYNGDGINIMMQDDGVIGPHIDYQGRLDQSHVSSSSGDHGDHVAGTIMGAGNLDPYGRGMSDAAFLYVFSSSNNNYYSVPAIYQNNDVIITSKSYSNGCNAGYTDLARDLDEQIRQYPSLIHVFSAGNDGTSDCGYGAGSGWGNVTGGHKQAKNVITTANLKYNSDLSTSSSRGPAHDGRIKPDIGAKGTSVYSTVDANDYDIKSGTSMACPGIAGVMGQLYQAYKELNGGINPPSALMKATLLNTADDLGNSGPDYKFGWGEVNALRALQVLENHQYVNDSVLHLGNNTHNITVPTGTKQVRIMVYWHDKEASVNASIALINNLDIELTTPSGTIYKPWVLDHTPNATNLNQTATRGVDDRNNMEQVTLNNPNGGTYSISVNGTSIPYGPQKYFVVYDIISEAITLTYPNGGEGFVPGDNEIIRWDAFGNSGSFTLEYSTDNGLSWTTISSTVSQSIRYYNWTVPNNFTGDALMRVSRGNQSDQSNENFTIINIPNNFVVDWICPDSIFFYWSPVTGATGYEISMLGQKYMDSIISSNGISAFYYNTNSQLTDNWFSIRAYITTSKKGRRAIAINAQSTNSGCAAPPIAFFTAISTTSCSGEITFIDQSSNNPISWLWDFGDGNTSNQQHPTHIYQNQGTYTVSLTVVNALGTDNIIETNYITVFYNPGPIAENDTICADSSSFNLISNSIGQISWYNDTINGNIIATGNNFTTPVLNSTTNYFLKKETTPVFGGPPDDNIGSGGFYNSNRHLFIDCYSPSTIVSFDVYAGSMNTITFELRDSTSNVIKDSTITVSLGLNTLYVDFDLPLGNNFELGIGAAGSDLWRSSSGASYPYHIGSLASITGHNSPNSTYYHYFFYNLQLQENCESEYTKVTAVLNSPLAIPVISQNGNQLSTINNALYYYQWYAGGVAINGANSSILNITQTGIYSVQVVYNGCNISSTDYNAVFTGIIDFNKSISIHPNPLSNLCIISCINPIEMIIISDLDGKKIKSYEVKNRKEFLIDLSSLSNGIYIAKIVSNISSSERKLIIQR